ncbi:MAG TPA: LCP family protein [Candidatus Binatia bacterium]|nr:LCP family protein [Candidatus Binatia bacterium]
MLSRITLPRATAAIVATVALVAIGSWIVLGRDQASAPLATPTAAPTASPTPSPTPRPTRRPTPRPTPTPSPTPTPVPDADAANVTILLVGRDFLAERIGQGESGMNTDMLIVANVRADGSRIDLVSLPRDSVDVPLGDGSIWSGKINGLRAARGLAALKGAMSATIGLPIDYYAEITLDDLARIVNAVGGVTVSLAGPLNDPHLHRSWSAGPNRLDGRGAVLFARSRFADSDYRRAERNQVLLVALRDRILAGGYDPIELLTTLPGLATDIPAADMPMLLELALDSADAPVTYKVLAPPAYTTFTGVAGARGWVSVPDLDAIRAYVDEIAAP